MKFRESGMPSEDLWKTFFNPAECVQKLGIDRNINTVVDVGCGYGTFLFPIAKLISGKVIGIDIDPKMVEVCNKKINEEAISNIQVIQGDVLDIDLQSVFSDYGGQVDYVTLFNILHCEEPVQLLSKVHRILGKNGRIGVIHWINKDTPRGPSMDIRLTPQMIINWANETGFVLEKQVELPPYHFGLVFRKLFQD